MPSYAMTRKRIEGVSGAGEGSRRTAPAAAAFTTAAILSVLGLTALAATAAPASAQEIVYPETPTVDVVDDFHGVEVADPYRWLEDTNSEETRAWIEAQNEVTFGYLEGVPGREALRERLTELWNYERYGVPWPRGDRYFFSRNDGLQDQSVLHVQDGPGDDPRQLLDPNTFSEDGTVSLAVTSPSPDGTLLGYGTSDGGSDWRTLHVRDVETGEDLEDRIEWVKFSGMTWTEDGGGFFYARYPEPEDDALLAENRDQTLYYHRLGTPQEEDVRVYERPDEPEWGFAPVVGDEGRYLVIHVWHGTDERNRVHYLDLRDPHDPRFDGEVVRLLDEFDASYTFLGNDGPVFYFLTDLDAPLRRVVAVDTRQPERENWREVIPESDDVLQGVQIVADRFVARYLRDASSRLVIHDLDGKPESEVELPTLGTVSAVRGERDGSEMFFAFTSFLHPTTVYRHDFEAGTTEVYREPEVDFDPEGYVTRQVFYESSDGTRVPMFLTHREGLERDGDNPVLLFGYGGFNIPVTPGFSVANLAWLEMGGIYAVANLRGGGEYGAEWHEAGRLGNKQNVFDDFIAAAEHLIDEGYTRPERLAIRGGSNGGLLVGAAMTQRPDLFGAALPAVGVLDMLRYHEFTIGWAWEPEFGSAEDAEAFEWLHAYSPYHNVEDGVCYPSTLVTTADHDDRVVPGHSFKFASRLQAAQGCDRPTLIRVETRVGHGAGTPVSRQIEQAVDRWSFLVRELGMEGEVAPGR